jgi:hypothetical protein
MHAFPTGVRRRLANDDPANTESWLRIDGSEKAGVDRYAGGPKRMRGEFDMDQLSWGGKRQ